MAWTNPDGCRHTRTHQTEVVPKFSVYIAGFLWKYFFKLCRHKFCCLHFWHFIGYDTFNLSGEDNHVIKVDQQKNPGGTGTSTFPSNVFIYAVTFLIFVLSKSLLDT